MIKIPDDLINKYLAKGEKIISYRENLFGYILETKKISFIERLLKTKLF